MIWVYLLSFITSLLTAAFSFLPVVTELPFGIDAAMTTVFGYFHAASAVIPLLDLLFGALLFYISFRVMLFVLRLMRITPSGLGR